MAGGETDLDAPAHEGSGALQIVKKSGQYARPDRKVPDSPSRDTLHACWGGVLAIFGQYPA